MAMPRVMMNGITVPMEIGSWFIKQTAGSAGCDGDHRPAMWMFAHSGTVKLRISEETPSASAHCRLTGMSRRGLGAQCGCVARNLVADERERVLVADQTCNLRTGCRCRSGA